MVSSLLEVSLSELLSDDFGLAFEVPIVFFWLFLLTVSDVISEALLSPVFFFCGATSFETLDDVAVVLLSVFF